MSYQDKSLTCLDCGTQFTFSADDQSFHAERGYTEPKRCPGCRQTRRNARGGPAGGDRTFAREMHRVTCAECGGQAQVPFEPRDGRPVYCGDCFRRQPAGARPRY